MSAVCLRGLEATDRDAIQAMLEATAAFRAEEVGVALELVDESLHDGAAAGYDWIVAEADTRTVGFACFGRVPMTDAAFDLYWIAVDPSHQRAGLARGIEQAVEQAVRAAAGRWLLAETSSLPAYEPARRFYLKQGYTLLSTIADYYRLGDDRLTFGKRLC